MNYELAKMHRDLTKLKADCEDFLKSSQREMEVLSQIRPTVNPPINIPPTSVETTPAKEPRQKQWRFMNEEGRIPESIVRKAAVDPNLLEAIGEELKARAEYERQ